MFAQKVHQVHENGFTSALNSSTGKASTALMFKEESGFMVAKPPETENVEKGTGALIFMLVT